MIAAPLVGLLAGWVSMASFVNVASAAQATGLIAEGAAGSFTAVLILLAAGGFATAIVALVRDAIWYLAAVAWALRSLATFSRYCSPGRSGPASSADSVAIVVDNSSPASAKNLSGSSNAANASGRCCCQCAWILCP